RYGVGLVVVPGEMVLLVEVVVDLERWNRRVPEIRVTRYHIVIHEVVVGRQRNQGLDFQRDRIHELRWNRVIRKRIPDNGAIRCESCSSRVINRVSNNLPAQRIHRRLPVHDERRQERLAEIASAISQSRDCCDSRVDELSFAELLEIEKEKSLARAVVELS